jgi:hypothetical protein
LNNTAPFRFAFLSGFSVPRSRHPNQLSPTVLQLIATRAFCDGLCVRSLSVSAISRELVTQGLTPATFDDKFGRLRLPQVERIDQ